MLEYSLGFRSRWGRCLGQRRGQELRRRVGQKPRRRLGHALLLAVLGVFVTSFIEPAQALPIRQSFAVSGGATFPIAPAEFTKFWNPGVAMAASVRFRMTPRVHLNFEVGYYRHLSNSDAFNELIGATQPNVTLSGYDLWVVPISLVGEFNLTKRGNTKPYVIFGGGLYKYGVTDASLSGFGADQIELPDLSETVVGFQVGLGLRTPVSLGTTLFIDAVWHFSATEGEARQFLPVRIGLQF